MKRVCSMLVNLNRRNCRCEMSAGQCPEDNIIAAFVSRNLSPEQMADIEAHLVRCRKCCEVVAFVIKCGADLPGFPFMDPSDS